MNYYYYKIYQMFHKQLHHISYLYFLIYYYDFVNKHHFYKFQMYYLLHFYYIILYILYTASLDIIIHALTFYFFFLFLPRLDLS